MWMVWRLLRIVFSISLEKQLPTQRIEFYGKRLTSQSKRLDRFYFLAQSVWLAVVCYENWCVQCVRLWLINGTCYHHSWITKTTETATFHVLDGLLQTLSHVWGCNSMARKSLRKFFTIKIQQTRTFSPGPQAQNTSIAKYVFSLSSTQANDSMHDDQLCSDNSVSF